MPRKRKTTTEIGPFATNLKKILDERQLTLAEVSKIVPCSKSTLHSWLQGTAPTDMALVLKLSRVLDVEFQTLLTNIPASTTPTTFNLEQFFHVSGENSLSGIFLLEAKKLTPKNK